LQTTVNCRFKAKANFLEQILWIYKSAHINQHKSTNLSFGQSLNFRLKKCGNTWKLDFGLHTTGRFRLKIILLQAEGWMDIRDIQRQKVIEVTI